MSAKNLAFRVAAHIQRMGRGAKVWNKGPHLRVYVTDGDRELGYINVKPELDVELTSEQVDALVDQALKSFLLSSPKEAPLENVMTKRCHRCRDGELVLYTGEGRKTSFCSCSRGQARAQADLKARLLAAFREG